MSTRGFLSVSVGSPVLSSERWTVGVASWDFIVAIGQRSSKNKEKVKHACALRELDRTLESSRMNSALSSKNPENVEIHHPIISFQERSFAVS